MAKTGEPVLRLRPRGNFVVLERFQTEEISKGGVVLPQQARAKLDKGRVVSIGPGDYEYGHRITPEGIRVGNVVHFISAPGTGLDVEHEGKLYHVLPARSVVAVVDEIPIDVVIEEGH